MSFFYVVTSYRDSQQVYRLVDLLARQSPSATIVVSHDLKSPVLDADRLSAGGVELIRTPRPVNWGDGSYLESILEALRYVGPGPDDWVTLLTAQDYPLRPLQEYEAHLIGSRADALLEVPEDSAAENELLGRYRSASFVVPRLLRRQKVLQMIAALPGVSWHLQPHGLPPRVDLRRVRTPFDRKFRIYRGSDHFAVNGTSVRALLDATDLLRYFVRCRIPSEAFPHTVLRNDPSIRVRPEWLHFEVWGKSSHPNWLDSSDLSAMLESGQWFARKFRDDAEVLDALDEALCSRRDAD